MSAGVMSTCCRPRPLAGIIAVSVLVADQVTKVLVQKNMFLGQSREIIPGFLNLTYVSNDGVAFGMLQGNNVLTGLIVLAILVLAAFWARQFDWSKTETNVIGGLLAGGAVGNLIDRFRVGYVIDFVDAHAAGWHWPAFNVADSAITCCMVWIAWRMLFPSGKIDRAPEGH